MIKISILFPNETFWLLVVWQILKISKTKNKLNQIQRDQVNCWIVHRMFCLVNGFYKWLVFQWFRPSIIVLYTLYRSLQLFHNKLKMRKKDNTNDEKVKHRHHFISVNFIKWWVDYTMTIHIYRYIHTSEYTTTAMHTHTNTIVTCAMLKESWKNPTLEARWSCTQDDRNDVLGREKKKKKRLKLKSMQEKKKNEAKIEEKNGVFYFGGFFFLSLILIFI